jgi:hypothetical protein
VFADSGVFKVFDLPERIPADDFRRAR